METVHFHPARHDFHVAVGSSVHVAFHSKVYIVVSFKNPVELMSSFEDPLGDRAPGGSWWTTCFKSFLRIRIV